MDTRRGSEACTLVASAVAALIACAPARAGATEPSRARVEMATDASVRRLLVDEDFEAARVLLDRLLVDATPELHAARTDLVIVLDAWASAGRRPSPQPLDRVRDVVDPEPAAEPARAIVAAREVLVRGAYAEAIRRLDAIHAAAPDAVLVARASELRTLAREALAKHLAQRGASADARSTSGGARTAREPAPRPTDDRGPRWYGWQTLIVDGASLLTLPFAPPIGVTGYFVGAPIVHLAHGRPLASLASVGARVVLPVGAMLAVGVGADDGWSRAIEGLAIGTVAAIALDASVLSWKREPRRQEEEARTAPVRRLTPTAHLRREGGVDVGVALAF